MNMYGDISDRVAKGTSLIIISGVFVLGLCFLSWMSVLLESLGNFKELNLQSSIVDEHVIVFDISDRTSMTESVDVYTGNNTIVQDDNRGLSSSVFIKLVLSFIVIIVFGFVSYKKHIKRKIMIDTSLETGTDGQLQSFENNDE